MEVKKIGDNIEFWPKIFFAADGEYKPKAINLAWSVGKSVQEKSEQEFVIDYVWEYEKYNIYIQALCGRTNRLNFFVFDNENNESFAFIQDSSVLEKIDLNRYPEKWYYLDDSVFDQIERLGFEWECAKIE